jgi:hypothetical protein
VYDHRITQAIMERRRRAKQAQGARIAQPQTSGPQRATRYGARVRFYVSEDYRRQHAQWRSALEELVDASSAVLGPAFALRFEASDLREWSPRCDRDQLAACLSELAAHDPGDKDLWIVGVLGDTPRYSRSFETLGMAHLVSSHFVLRDVADLAERQAIDEAFPTHTAGQRSEIYTRRKRHKRLAIFLHEWAHTLGGLHSPEAMDLLHPAYDDRMTAFGDANAALIELGLEARYAEDEARLRDYVSRLESSRFAAGERDQLMARLDRPPAARSSAAAVAPARAPSEGEDPLLSAVDQQALRTAQQQADSGATIEAWTQIAQLVERYPSSKSVQQLACSLSMRRGDFTAAQTSCTRVQALSR